jgi:hypothetical protein
MAPFSDELRGGQEAKFLNLIGMYNVGITQYCIGALSACPLGEFFLEKSIVKELHAPKFKQ